MYPDGGTMVVRKRLSFLSVAFICLTAIIVTTVVTASGVAVYGIRMLDAKTETLVGLVREAAGSLPEFRESLPPALADTLDDVRRPDYVKELDISVRLAGIDRRGRARAVVEVANRGDEVVSLLSMRVVGLDDEGDPLIERNTWAATPLQIDDDWRGPILPNETRRFPVRFCRGNEEVVGLTHEITDIRLWRGSGDIDSVQTAAAASSGFTPDDARGPHPMQGRRRV